MNTERRKELLDEWKNRSPEMGVISICCKLTGDLFIGISKDTRADFNSNRFKLAANGHPNKQLQKLWNEYGADSFEFSLVKKLKYENPHDDHTQKLKDLLEEYSAEMPQANKIWR